MALLHHDIQLSSLGKAQMRALGITRVFDLRSDTEIEKYRTPLPLIDGVDVLRTPVFRWEDYSPEMMAKYVRAPAVPVLPTVSRPFTSNTLIDGISYTPAEKPKYAISCEIHSRLLNV